MAKAPNSVNEKTETVIDGNVNTGTEQSANTGTEQPGNTDTEQSKSVSQQLAEQQSEAAQGDGNSVETEGVRARRGLSLKQLLPSTDWINQNVVGRGKGTKAVVGKIVGIATSVQRRQNTVNDKVIDSIAVIGMFDMESYLTGEISRGSSCFFPMAYAEMIEAAFKSDKLITAIDVDCDIGLEATGKTIPYEWVTTAFREGKEMSTLKRLRTARPKPTNLITGPGGQPLLTAPGK